MVADKQIRISEKTKQILDNNKIHPRETYDDLLMRWYLNNLPEPSKKLKKAIKKGLEV